MSLPNLSSESSGGGSDPIGMTVDAASESAFSEAVESGYRAASDLATESGLDGFASEDGEAETSARIPTAPTGWTASPDAARVIPSVRTGSESAPHPDSSVKVLSIATRALSQARGSVAGISGRGAIAAFVPRHFDRIVSTAAFVGQTSARVGKSLTRPRWHLDTRLVVLIVLSTIAFAEIWWVGRRLSSPAESLVQSAALEPVVTESAEDIVSGDGKGADPLRMRVTFRSVAPAGSTVSRRTPVPPAWVTISAPMPVEIYEHGQQIGTSWNGGMRLTPGPHDLRIVNRSMGVDLPKSVEAVSGAMASLSVAFPPGALQITATPWATVEVDGIEVGKTPLAKVELSPGRHDVVFTHPKFGQRKVSVTVRSGKAQRLGVDLRRRGR
jgi:hypothetical protein